MVTGKEKGIFSSVQQLFRWCFYVKRFEWVWKKQLKIYFNWTFYLPCFILSSWSYMNIPISNRNLCNMLHGVFAFLPSHSIFEGTTMEMELHCSFVLSLPLHLLSSYQDSGKEFSFGNVNLYKSNVVQIFELIFCDSER